MPLFGRNDTPDLVAARADAESALPERWQLVGDDKEGFLITGEGFEFTLNVWAAAAIGPNGETEVGVACDKPGAYIALGRRLRGDLEQSDAWSPLPGFVQRD
jgi:hypothetical protein